MARRGRPPKPTALHKLEGTMRASVRKRRMAEPKPKGALGKPPDWLGPGARQAWNYALRNAPPGLLTRLDAGVLAVWAAAEDRLRVAQQNQALLDAGSLNPPLLVRGSKGSLIVSPYIEVITSAGRQMLQCADRLGFSPAARPRISIEPELPAPAAPVGDDGWGPLQRFPVYAGGKAKA